MKVSGNEWDISLSVESCKGWLMGRPPKGASNWAARRAVSLYILYIYYLFTGLNAEQYTEILICGTPERKRQYIIAIYCL